MIGQEIDGPMTYIRKVVIGIADLSSEVIIALSLLRIRLSDYDTWLMASPSVTSDGPSRRFVSALVCRFEAKTASSTKPQPSCPVVPSKRLDTLPPEVRAVVYSHLFDHLQLKISREGYLNIKDYPWQISAVSRLLRNETLPILLGKYQVYPLQLICEHGRFPDFIRRCIPNRVLYGISVIIITDYLIHDDIKPSLTSFPGLSELRLNLLRFMAPEQWGKDYIAKEHGEGILSPLPDEEVVRLIDYVKQDKIMSIAAEMKREQERPREGLERDYLAEGTLYQILSMDRRRRGFTVTVEVDLLGYERSLYESSSHCGTVKIEDWDSGRGRHIRHSKRKGV